MDAGDTTSPGRADGTERPSVLILVPLTLLGAFDLTGVMAVASAARRSDQPRSRRESGRRKSA